MHSGAVGPALDLKIILCEEDSFSGSPGEVNHFSVLYIPL